MSGRGRENNIIADRNNGEGLSRASTTMSTRSENDAPREVKGIYHEEVVSGLNKTLVNNDRNYLFHSGYGRRVRRW